MTKEQITHKTLADLVGVSETTIKSYRRKFPDCIPVASQGKPIRFTAEAKDVVKRIHEYFLLGMSVQEVRARLVEEFSFIKPEEEGKKPSKAQGEISPELTQGVSNMAKSLVNMAGQQRTILQRVEGIESILEELGLSGIQHSEEARKKRLEEARQKEIKLERRLDQLDTATKELSDAVTAIAQGFHQFLEQQRTVQAYAREQLESETSSESDGSQEESYSTSFTTEPERTFLSYPLVAKTTEGRYVSAGGRSRGRFSLNDLKAMLVYGFNTPNRFAMRWHPQEGNWWLLLDQPEHEQGVTLQLLLTEFATQRGSVVEVIQMACDGQMVHPEELCQVIDEIMSRFAE